VLFGIRDLATAVQHGINLVVVVFNNRGYGNVRRDQAERYKSRFIGADLSNPDFVRLAESFGAMGLRARSPDELTQQPTRAFSADRPVVIEVPCEPGSETSPWPLLMPNPPVLH
jgi:acetolactate synthase-1/2/3 large subunit